jgi:hypothetical protein
MFSDLYISGPIPHQGYTKNDKSSNKLRTDPFIAAHAEIERPEYDYAWNSDGLRSVEFSSKPNVVAIGCSLTLGQGLPVEARWSNILENMLLPHGNFSIGNISYSGAAINKDVSSFFGMINKYEYLPEYVICNFANFERFYFVSPEADRLQDWYINYSEKKTKVSAPWNYQEILPYEWVYYQNLDHIKMLETFCNMNNIKLIWSCWSNALTDDDELFLQANFKNYIKDPVRKEFPPDFEFVIPQVEIKNLEPHYKMNNWEEIQCHKEYKEMYPEIFDFGYDYQKNPGSWGPGSHRPHPGMHKQIHWAEFYYKQMIRLIDVGNSKRI